MKTTRLKHPTIVLDPAQVEDFQDFSDHYVEGKSYIARMGEQPLGVIAEDRVFVFPEFQNFGIDALLHEMLK